MSQDSECPTVGAVQLRFRRAFILFLIAPGAMILYKYPPDRYSFYPRCPIEEYLHVQCPGCGMTRACAALLHGDLAAALHFNAFGVLVLVPLALGYFALCFQRALKDEGFRWPNIPPSATIALFALAAVFTLFRNL